MKLLPGLSKHISSASLLVLFILGLAPWSHAQELNCRVIVNADQIQTQDRLVFRDMEVAFAEFLNGRKWTSDVMQNEERIKCNLSITIDKMPQIGSFTATVQIQSARPVYGGNYESIVLNFADRDWTFEYVQSLPLDFNENAYTTNLTSMLAYYAAIIIGMDYDTFGELSGTQYYQLAQNIVTNATPSNRPGWSALVGIRNRYFLVENLMNQRFIDIRKGYYTYHRQGLDIYQENPEAAQQNILAVLKDIREAGQINPNAIIIISFMDAKADELVNIFSTGNLQLRREAYNVLVEIDPSKRDKFARILSN